MTDLTYTTGDRVSWFDDDNNAHEGVVQQRSTRSITHAGKTLNGGEDNAALHILSASNTHVLKQERDVRRVIIPV